ncbi:MAG: insulinase family protein, partial [Prevotellaceae bacterium]|nr:insulinase family protein [Prevotellaceae bacterium]
TAIGKKFYAMACDFSIQVDLKHTRFVLAGLNSNLKEALPLFMKLVNTGTISRTDYLKDVASFIKAHNDAKKNQLSNFNALFDYASMGAFNPSTNIMTPAELEAADGNNLMDEIRMLARQFPMTVLYYGPSKQQEITLMVKQNCLPRTFVAVPTATQKAYTMQTTPRDEVYIAPYDAKNIYMIQYNNENKAWTPAQEPMNALFNEYFGGGMNAIVFQELREARALAYSAGARYRSPAYKGYPEYFTTRIITQNDKMMDCIKAFSDLLNNMPQRQAGLDLAKQSLLKSLATERTTKFSVLRAYMRALDRGIDYDISKSIYESIPAFTLQDLAKFARENISGKPYRYVILGDEKNLDMKSLEKIAPVKRLTTEQIFGY